MNTFGKKLKQLRIDKNMTQELLAEKLYVSRQSVSQWENNICYPDIETLKQISEIFEVTIDNLLYDNNKHIIERAILTTEKKSASITNKMRYVAILLTICVVYIIITGIVLIIRNNQANKSNDYITYSVSSTTEFKEELIRIPAKTMDDLKFVEIYDKVVDSYIEYYEKYKTYKVEDLLFYASPKEYIEIIINERGNIKNITLPNITVFLKDNQEYSKMKLSVKKQPVWFTNTDSNSIKIEYRQGNLIFYVYVNGSSPSNIPQSNVLINFQQVITIVQEDIDNLFVWPYNILTYRYYLWQK